MAKVVVRQPDVALCGLRRWLQFSFTLLLAVLVTVSCQAAASATGDKVITVAVASNFQSTLKRLLTEYQRQQGDCCNLVAGASGVLYAQIVHGAPYHLFLSADTVRPQALFKKGIAQAPTTYALGRLAYWQKQAVPNDLSALASLTGKLVIANPQLAPYGRAALQTLEALGLQQAFAGRLVRGNNINQVYQFVDSGNAAGGFVAYSQLLDAGQTDLLLVPAAYYQPIEQQMVVVTGNHGQQQVNRAANLFNYLQSQSARDIIAAAGYWLPDNNDESRGGSVQP